MTRTASGRRPRKPARAEPAADTRASLPGRYCPSDYAYGPAVLCTGPVIEADVLYVVGGLYGNTVALGALRTLRDAERRGRVQVVFNGDFHWFDVHAQQFAAISRVLDWGHAIRGNVETELSRPGADDSLDAGCGCAYPDDVPDADVERSNRILARLRATAREADAFQRLSALPMTLRAQVGPARVGIVHGDDRSLAGWRLAHDRLAGSWADGLAGSFDAAQIDVLACSHTCLPVADSNESGGRARVVINNGAAGMGNFGGLLSGVVTRIAVPGLAAPAGARVLYAARVSGVEVAALELAFDQPRWRALFARQWPVGSPAHLSYWSRISAGPGYHLEQAVRGRFRKGPSP
jgi:hypothetical protein